MKYNVTRYGPGGIETITVEADGGDEAATRAYKPGTIIRGIEPAPADDPVEIPVRKRRTAEAD